VFDKSQGDVAYAILNYEWKIETYVPERKVNELFSDQEIGKTRMLQSEESRQNPSRSFWARIK
jgi:hypothetical protein